MDNARTARFQLARFTYPTVPTELIVQEEAVLVGPVVQVVTRTGHGNVMVSVRGKES